MDYRPTPETNRLHLFSANRAKSRKTASKYQENLATAEIQIKSRDQPRVTAIEEQVYWLVNGTNKLDALTPHACEVEELSTPQDRLRAHQPRRHSNLPTSSKPRGTPPLH